MINLKAKIGAGVVTAAMLGSLLAPAAFADTTITIGGNGANSTSKVKVTKVDKTKVVQGNETLVMTGVSSTAKTGGNKANQNTGGGNVKVKSGDATSNVTVGVGGSSNSATLANCGCAEGDTNVTIEDNGAHSTNKVKVSNVNKTKVEQYNSSAIITEIDSKAKTGGNKANQNTGEGSVTVKSGDADSTVLVAVEGSVNTLNP